jgi:hypothetical protein
MTPRPTHRQRAVIWTAQLALAAAAAVSSTARVAHADSPADRLNRADQLFAEGRALLPSNLNQACDKFEESLRYNPAAIGTLLNVALCDEKLGRVASAIAKFAEARNRAKEQNLPEHLRAADDHIATLLPEVPHLKIELTRPVPETKVLVDDRVIDAGELGDIALDPGARVVVVGAPDHLPFRTTVIIAKAEHRTVVVPALAAAVTVSSSRRRFGLIGAIVGGTAFGTSIGLALYGRHLHNQQFDEGHCAAHGDAKPSCDPTGQARTDRAITYGSVATIVGSLGLAVGAAGVALWLLSPPVARVEPPVAFVPAVTGDEVGVVAVGRF